MSSWNVIYYTSSNGSSPVTDFIDGLDDTAQVKVINTVRLLKEFGIQLGGSHTKKLRGTNIWELRILGSDSIRVIYVAIEGQTFLLLHSFKKKSFKTPPKELKIATNRLRDYRSRK
jgi:phage-related protein